MIRNLETRDLNLPSENARERGGGGGWRTKLMSLTTTQKYVYGVKKCEAERYIKEGAAAPELFKITEMPLVSV